MERDHVTDTLESVGAVVLANACGPCIGQVCMYSCRNVPIWLTDEAVETRR
jgi:aconitase A